MNIYFLLAWGWLLVQAWKYLRNFLGVMAISLFLFLPFNSVSASTKFTENEYTSFYNSLNYDSSTGKYTLTVTDDFFRGNTFNIDFSNNFYVSDSIFYGSDSGISIGLLFPEGGYIGILPIVGKPYSFNREANSFRIFIPKDCPVGSKFVFSILDGNKNVANPSLKPLTSQPYYVPDSTTAPPKDYDSFIDLIVDSVINGFKDLKYYGIKIVILAIGLGVIFIGGKWLWIKVKQWLSNV